MKTKALTMVIMAAVLAASIVLVFAPGADADETEVLAEDSVPLATVSGITVEGTVEGNGTETVTYTVSGGTLTWAPADKTIDRNIGGWWYGYRFTVDVTQKGDLESARFSNNNGKTWKDFLPVVDSGESVPVYLNAWGFINDAYIKNANGGYLTYTYLFDWNGDEVVDQTIYVKMDTNDITLKDIEGNIVLADGKFEGIAMTDGVIYATVNEAIAAIEDEGAVRLVTDVIEDVVIPSGKNIVLDLSGNTLTNSKADTITVDYGATLTIKDTSVGGTVDNITNQMATIYNNGTVILLGGTYVRSMETGVDKDTPGNNTYYTILNHGSMTIEDGVTVENKGHYSSLFDNGYFGYTKTSPRQGYVEGTNSAAPGLTINGGTFTGGLNTIKNDDAAILTINGGTFTNYTQAAFQNHNVATINDGSFNAESVYAIDNCGCDATHDVGLLTINGGTFTGDINNRSEFSKVTINGGTFNGSFVGANTDVTINAGVFKKAIPVALKVASEAAIGDTYYAKISEAVAVGGTIEVLNNIASTDAIQIAKAVTINGNGKTFAGTFNVVASEDGAYAVKVNGLKTSAFTGDIDKVTLDATGTDSFTITFGTLKLTIPATKTFASDGKKISVSEASIEGTVPQGFDLIASSKLTIPAGKSVEGAVWFDDLKDNGLALNRVTAGTKGVTMTKGSVEIVGDFTSTEDGTITVTGIARIVGNSDLEGVDIVVPKGASLTVEEGITLSGDGTVDNSGTVKVLGNVEAALDNKEGSTVQVALTGSIDMDRVQGKDVVAFDSIVIRDIGAKYYRVGDKVDIPVTVNPTTATLAIDYSVSPSWLSIRDGHIVGVVVQDGSFNVTVKASMEDRETVSESFVLNAVPGTNPDAQEPAHEYTVKEIVKFAVIILVALVAICLIGRIFIG